MDIIESAKCNIRDAISEVKALISANDGVGVAHWSAFILCSCILDYLASYRYAVANGSNGDKFKRFIREYLNVANPNHQYNADDIYHWLRCGMVHGYTDMYKGQTKFLFTHLFDGLHLKLASFRTASGDTGTRTVVRLQDFLADIEIASITMFEDAVNADVNDEIFKSIERRVGEVGVKRSDFEIAN